MLFSCQSVFAISGKDAVHYMSREPQRQAYAKAQAQAQASTLSRIASGSSGTGVNKSVISQINGSSTVPDGSKVSGGGSVTKPVNPSSVAKTMVGRLEKAKAFGKASLPSFVGSAVLTALVHAVGGSQDDDGSISTPVKPDPNGEATPSVKSGWRVVLSSGSNKYYNSPDSAYVAWCSSFSCDFTKSNYQPQGNDSIYMTARSSDNVYLGGATSTYAPNPIYDPDYALPSVPVSGSSLESMIQNYINNNDNSITNNIINNAYSYDSSNGATPSSDTNTLAVDAHKDISDAITKASTAPYNASIPTKGYYMITYGEKTVEGWVDASPSTGTSSSDTTNTVTNSDGSTSTETGTSSSEFTFPAFCDWASIVCDFIDWVKEDDDQEEEPIEPDTTILNREFDTNFNLTGQCPPNPIIPMPMGLSLELPFSKICDFFGYLKFGVITAASLLSAWILYGAVNKGAE